MRKRSPCKTVDTSILIGKTVRVRRFYMANIKLRTFKEISTKTAVFKIDIRHTISPSRKFVPNFVLLYSCFQLGSYTKRNKKQNVPILFERFNLEYAWIRQPRSGSCHYPTAATKCNVLRTELCNSVYHRLRKL